jgi:rhamnopyranosyl-N-acetylglucosaminyl-diphospho-decaprenol beta-1,3/1,4-galactofuranosyltransferase
MNKICAIVVTFNRINLLKDVIKSLRNQSFKLDEILVVNNNSSDGTKEWLDNQKDLKIIHQGNYGGAGGFSTGVEWAFKNGFEWFWLMDDDIEMAPDCLETLIKFKGLSECLHPVKYYTDNVMMNWESFLDPTTGRVISLYNKGLDDKEITYVNVGNFEGMLISRNVVGKIGFPDKRFFINGDDLIYGYLASFHTNVSIVNNAKMIRKKKSIDDEILSDFAIYYFLRNLYLKNEILDLKYPNYKRLRNFYTNLIFLKTFFAVFRGSIVRNSFKEKLISLKNVLRAYKDYKQRKINNTF